MGKTWLTHIVSFWVLIHGLLVASRLFNLLLNLNVGGVRLPLGPLAYVGLIIAAVVVIRRKPGPSVEAAAVLAVPTFGI